MVYPIAKRLLFPIMRLWVKKEYGLENIPKDKPFIFAANHASYLDDFSVAPFIAGYLDKKVHMYCNDRFYKNKLFAAFLNWAECIPISAEDGKKEKNKKALELALRFLKKKDIVGIFPEGGRSHDGKLKEAKTGVAKLALLSKSPILPVGIIGSYNVLPKGAFFPKFKRYTVKIGKPIYLDKYFGKEDDKKTLKEITTQVMKNIARLTGEEYI
jgi:1-acyl-sn-glycerol-3-phosphate acyltransferase